MKLRIIISITILFTILLVLLPKPSGDSKLHIASASMVMCVADLKKSISQALETNTPIKTHADNQCPSLISDLQVDDDGRINMKNARHGISMVLEPMQDVTGIKWSCRGTPANAITPLCRKINIQPQSGDSGFSETSPLPPE